MPVDSEYAIMKPATRRRGSSGRPARRPPACPCRPSMPSHATQFRLAHSGESDDADSVAAATIHSHSARQRGSKISRYGSEAAPAAGRRRWRRRSSSTSVTAPSWSASSSFTDSGSSHSNTACTELPVPGRDPVAGLARPALPRTEIPRAPVRWSSRASRARTPARPRWRQPLAVWPAAARDTDSSKLPNLAGMTPMIVSDTRSRRWLGQRRTESRRLHVRARRR